MTKSAIDGFAVAERDTVYWDQGLPGFGVKVTPRGRKVFIVMYRLGGAGSRLRKYTIGPYGRITLPMARAQAQKIFAARLDGRDPAEEKHQARRRLVVDQVEDLVETFIRERLSKVRTARTLSNRLRRDLIPYWGAKSIHDVKKRDVIDLVSKISERNSHAGHRLLKLLKTFFRWCVGRAVIEVSPAEGLSTDYREVSRDRVLNDNELAAVIIAARKMPWPYGGIVEFLALTGQRREEVVQASPGEIDAEARTWCIPAHRTKNGKAHIVHLSVPAWAVISKHLSGKYIFPTSTGHRFQAYSQSKRLLDELSGIRGWRLHDLRRTIVSGMARTGIPPHVADKILNHQSGTISGVAAVYQRHDFLTERKDALDRWGAHVTELVRNLRAGDQLIRPNADVGCSMDSVAKLEWPLRLNRAFVFWSGVCALR